MIATRYPWTYACDWLKMQGKATSRSEASQLIGQDLDRAKALADKYLEHEALLVRAEALLQDLPQTVTEDSPA